jgi:hypothetical protein
MDQQKLMKAIMAIQNDISLNDVEKAKKRQELLSGKFGAPSSNSEGAKHPKSQGTWVVYFHLSKFCNILYLHSALL